MPDISLVQFFKLCLFVPAAIRWPECPDGWLQVEDQCFFLSTGKRDFSASAEKCKDMGAHLAILTTREQHVSVFLCAFYIFLCLFFI